MVSNEAIVKVIIGFIIVLAFIWVIWWHFLPHELVGYFQADDRLLVHVFDAQGIQKGSYDGKDIGWQTVQEVKVPVNRGDRVVFVVANKGGPGGIIGKWKWKDQVYVSNTKAFLNEDAKGVAYGQPMYDAKAKFSDPWKLAGDFYPAGAEWVWRNEDEKTICGWHKECSNSFVWVAPSEFMMPKFALDAANEAGKASEKVVA